MPLSLCSAGCHLEETTQKIAPKNAKVKAAEPLLALV